MGKSRSQGARSSWRDGIGRHFTAGNQDEGRVALVVKNLPASAGDIRPGGQDPLEEGQQPTPLFLPGESHGHRSLVGYGPQGPKELDTTEVT